MKIQQINSPLNDNVFGISATLDGLVKFSTKHYMLAMDPAAAEQAAKQLQAAAKTARHVQTVAKTAPAGLNEEGMIAFLQQALIDNPEV